MRCEADFPGEPKTIGDLMTSPNPARAFWETPREISHQEADDAATRLINSHFKNDAERARISIPANPERDDDLIIRSYIRQQMRLSAAKPPASGVEEACEAAIRLSYFSKGRIMSYEGQPLGKGRLKADIQVVLEALPDTIRPPAEHGEAALDFYTADRLLTYVPETGDLLWRVHRGPKPKGSKAGCIRKDGYSYVVIGRKKFLAHRLCWLLHYGEWPSEHVDHINMNKVDNRLLNLRAATSAQNNLNRTKQSNNSSGFKGVRFHKKSGKYLANIVFEGVKRHLGQFPTPQEASEAYRKAAKELHGEFFNHS